jgi:predicted Fe-Mo cluster-binding NifX family protein
MIVAVPCSGDRVEANFGNARAFTIARAEEGAIAGSSVVDWTGEAEPDPANEPALVGFFHRHGVEIILAGAIGYPMQQALKSAGFTVYSGVSGEVAAALQAFLLDDIEPASPSNRPLHGPPWAR